MNYVICRGSSWTQTHIVFRSNHNWVSNLGRALHFNTEQEANEFAKRKCRFKGWAVLPAKPCPTSKQLNETLQTKEIAL